jgi:hypothetical protein
MAYVMDKCDMANTENIWDNENRIIVIDFLVFDFSEQCLGLWKIYDKLTISK